MSALAPGGTWGPYQTQAVPPSTVAWPMCGPVTFWPPSAALASAAVTTLQDVGSPAAGAEAADVAATGGVAAGDELVAGAGELQATISAGAARLASTAKLRHARRECAGLVPAPVMAAGPGRAAVRPTAGAAPFTGRSAMAVTGICRLLAGVSFMSDPLWLSRHWPENCPAGARAPGSFLGF